MVSALSLSASAQSQNTFYLHASYLLDQNAPTGTTANALKLATGVNYVWKSTSYSTQVSFPAGTWTTAVWMNMTQGPTQYRLKLGTVNIYGGFAEAAHSFTPIVTSASPARYEVSISVGVLDVPAGDSLAMGFLDQWQNASLSPAAFIFFDSQVTSSSLTGPVVVTTVATTSTATQATTQQTTTTTQHTATTQTATQQTTTTTTSSTAATTSQPSQSMLYLHAAFLLDQNARTATTPNVLALTGGQYYVWKTTSFAAGQSFPSATWVASVWMSMIEEPTQYKMGLGVVNSSGAFVDYDHSFTPMITSPSPAQYDVSISAEAFNVAAGESLAIGFLRQWQNGSYSPPAFIYLDSQTMPSGLSSPAVTTTSTTQTTTHETTTTTQQTATTQTATQRTTTQTATQQMTTVTKESTTTMAAVGSSLGMGWAFALIGIGIGVACAGGGVAAALSGRQYPQVFAYDGYYYCVKHRVPVWYVQGHLWCPVERRYLR